MAPFSRGLAEIRLIKSHESADVQRLQKFIDEINPRLNQLNQKIKVFNSTDNVSEKIEILRQIHQEQKKIDNDYPSDVISQCSEYRQQIHQELFNNIKTQCIALGIDSIYSLSHPTHTQSSASLPEILTNMSPDKVNKLLQILHENVTKINELYSVTDPEYTQFQHFLSNYELSFLGGTNSKNFKVTSRLDGTHTILKVDNRLDMPKHVDAHLREGALKEHLTPVTAERQASAEVVVNGEKQFVTRTLLTTEYCASGNIEEYASKLNSTQKLESAIDICSQMGSVLQQMTEAGTAFPDMKNSNWLVNNRGRVQIADTKSFLFTDSNGLVDSKLPANRWCKLLQTRSVNAPEFLSYEFQPFSADRMHSYLLGKNLYQYVTGCESSALADLDPIEKYQFAQPIFESALGEEERDLIMVLTDPVIENRLSVKEALDKLAEIPAIAREKLIKQIEAHSFLSSDEAEFVKAIKKELNSLNDAEQKEKIAKLEELRALLNSRQQFSQGIEQLKNNQFLSTEETQSLQEIQQTLKLFDVDKVKEKTTELKSVSTLIELRTSLDKRIRQLKTNPLLEPEEIDVLSKMGNDIKAFSAEQVNQGSEFLKNLSSQLALRPQYRDLLSRVETNKNLLNLDEQSLFEKINKELKTANPLEMKNNMAELERLVARIKPRIQCLERINEVDKNKQFLSHEDIEVLHSIKQGLNTFDAEQVKEKIEILKGFSPKYEFFKRLALLETHKALLDFNNAGLFKKIKQEVEKAGGVRLPELESKLEGIYIIFLKSRINQLLKPLESNKFWAAKPDSFREEIKRSINGYDISHLDKAREALEYASIQCEVQARGDELINNEFISDEESRLLQLIQHECRDITLPQQQLEEHKTKLAGLKTMVNLRGQYYSSFAKLEKYKALVCQDISEQLQHERIKINAYDVPTLREKNNEAKSQLIDSMQRYGTALLKTAKQHWGESNNPHLQKINKWLKEVEGLKSKKPSQRPSDDKLVTAEKNLEAIEKSIMPLLKKEQQELIIQKPTETQNNLKTTLQELRSGTSQKVTKHETTNQLKEKLAVLKSEQAELNDAEQEANSPKP